MNNQKIVRGDIFWVDFDPSKNTEIKKIRPALVCSHDLINENSSRIIVAPISSNVKKFYNNFEYLIKDNGNVNGKVMLDQIRTVDKSRLGKKLGNLTYSEMNEIEEILKFVLAIR